ncbi:40_t:CDS:1, partial [Cetraspora pellucida]
ALNYNGGHTEHSLFCIPIKNNDNGCKCQINPNSEHAKLIQESIAITWNKMLMAQKDNIEAVDILLHELYNCNLLFGRKIFVGVGDFHQVAPIISNARKTATILESIKSSSI